MKPSEVQRALTCCIEARQPAIVWGSPGIGKSQVIAWLAGELQSELIDIRAPQFDAVDLRGLPSITAGSTVWNTPDFWPKSGCPRSIIFLDELNRAPVMVQNALLQLVLDRKLGDYVVPDNVDIVSACNEVTHGGGVQKMPAALCNRFVHVTMEPDLDDWCKWAIRANVEPSVIAFLRFRPNLLSQFDANAKAFPTPRSWEFVSRITAKQPGNGIELALYEGSVGHGAAIEYSAFLRMFRSLPNIDAILMNPTQATVPTAVETLFAVSSALARRATVTNLARVIQYLDRIPTEYAVFAMQDAIRRDSTLTGTSEFNAWTIGHAEVLF